METEDRLERRFQLYRDGVLRDAERIINPPPPPTRWERFKSAWFRYWEGY